jgi:phosphate transport system substrate-binding protein
MSEIEKFRKQKKFWSKERKNIVIVVVVFIIIGVVAYSFLAPRPKSIKIEGAYALTPMMEKWALEYKKFHPDINIDITANGAGQGMADALKGIADIGMVSREIKDSEIDQGAFWVSVCKDAVVATINSDNPVIDKILEKGVTKQQFLDIFITRNIKTWGQLVGTDNEDLIEVYTRKDTCGAAETWAKYLGNYTQYDLTNNADSTIEGDNDLASKIIEKKYAIGYNNIGYVYTKKIDDKTTVPADGIIPVPIDRNENGTLDEYEKVYENRTSIVTAINNKVYPSPPARELHLVTKNSFTDDTKDFVYWILTEGQQYVLDAGYVPLPTETIATQISYLQNGTRPEI